MATVLILGAGGSAAANFVDALRRSEHRYRVIGVDASPTHLHLAEADERAIIPRADDEGYLAALQRLIERHSVDFVHPQPDPDVRAVSRMRDQISASTYLPSHAAIELAADKLAFAAAMGAAGVSVPDAATVGSERHLGEVVEGMLGRHEKLWVRARVGAGARASLPVRSADQAIAWVRWWMQERGMTAQDFMVSEFLGGREFAYQSVWQDGELVAGQARERVEYLYGHLTPSGQTSTPSVARTVSLPKVDELACAAIRALDPQPRGVYCVDIKESATGEPKVTEINAGRFFTTSNFYAHAGLNMPDMLVRCGLGERPPRRGSSPLPPDLYWIRMVDMPYRMVRGEDLDCWPRADS
jgi:predicted ATP-grasp superfamily ATP-dependent carboligase